MKTSLMMIINPAAGRGGYKQGLPEALKLLSDAGYAVSLFFTEYRGHATELASQYGANFDKLLCLGGDGTLAEVIAGLMTLNKRPQVGYIPIGTANDIARTLGLVKNDIAGGARRFIKGKPLPFDTGMRDGGYFNYVAAFGAFTEVSYATPQDAKQKLGQAAYLIGAAKSLKSLKSRHVRVVYDDGEIDGEFLYGGMSNSYSVGGTVELPRDMIDLGDGKHELILVRKLPSAAAVLPLAAKVVINHDFSSESIIILQTRKAKFIFDEPETWSFDGEDGGAQLEICFENCPQAVEIIC